MSRTRSADISPDFIAARTPKELRRLLLVLQQSLGGELKYISISWDGKNWVAWFFNDLRDASLTEALAKTRG